MILPIAVPVFFWAVYHYHKDRHLPEPLGNLVLTFVLGMLAVGISTALYTGLGEIGLRFDAGNLADTSGLGIIIKQPLFFLNPLNKEIFANFGLNGVPGLKGHPFNRCPGF